jgi:hypothetical protein
MFLLVSKLLFSSEQLVREEAVVSLTYTQHVLVSVESTTFQYNETFAGDPGKEVTAAWLSLIPSKNLYSLVQCRVQVLHPRTGV